ncbi:hypothetical protein JHK87_013087 [Glycine soja]|nr:hypothetical protein JHK87_013087 [Glycine soja]
MSPKRMMALALNISVWFPQQRCPTLFKPFPSPSSTQLSVGEDLLANYSKRCIILLHPTMFRDPYGVGDLFMPPPSRTFMLNPSRESNPNPCLSEPGAMQGGVVAPTKTMNVSDGDEETHGVVDKHQI